MSNELINSDSQQAQEHLNELFGRYRSISSTLEGLVHQSDTSSVISAVLDTILKELNADKIYIFSYDDKTKTHSCLYERVVEGMDAMIDSLQKISATDFVWTSLQVVDERSVMAIDDVEAMPEEVAWEQALFRAHKVRSALAVPMVNKDVVSGYIYVTHVKKTHKWSDTDKLWLESIASFINISLSLRTAQMEASREREYFKNMYQNMPIGFIRVKLLRDKGGVISDFRYMEINRIATTQLGFKSEDEILDKLASNLSVALLKSRLRILREVDATREVFHDRLYFEAADRFLDYTAYMGNNDEVFVLIVDNTDTIKASQALKKSEDILKNLYGNLPVGVEIYDKSGHLVSINEMGCKIYGFDSVEDVLGISIFDDPNMPSTFLEELRANKPAWCDFYYDFALVRGYYTSRHTGRIHMLLKGVALLDDHGEVANYLLIAMDNSDALKANHKIREFELLFNSIAQFSELGLCQVNPCNKSIFATDQWYENLCCQNREVSLVMDAYAKVHHEDRVRMKERFEQMFTGQISSMREEIRVFDGKDWKWLRCTYKVSDYRPEDNVIEVIGINIDITELKRTESSLIEAKQRAEQSDKLKSAFIANMSHEIRTPLNAIVGFSDMLIGCQEVEQREEYIGMIKQNNELLLQLVSDILDLSKIESEKIELNVDFIDLEDMCQQTVDLFAYRIKSGVRVYYNKMMPQKMVVVADRNRLIQVMSNLLSNAVKFTTQGTISLGYRIVDDMVEFSISDTGSGIDQNKLDLIFDRFVKLNEFVQGTGLGLAICRSLVERMGGRIWATSELGKGTTFFFTIPVQETQIEDMEGLTAQERDLELDKPLILVAEDTESNYLLLNSILKRDYRLLRAKDGLQAVDLYAQHRPRVVLMDIKMPNMDGLQATHHIMAVDRSAKIIALTAYAFTSDKEAAFDAGCCDFISKPVNVVELREKVARYLKQK